MSCDTWFKTGRKILGGCASEAKQYYDSTIYFTVFKGFNSSCVPLTLYKMIVNTRDPLKAAADVSWAWFWLKSSHYVNIVRFNEAGSPWSAQTHSALGEIMGEVLNLPGTSLGGITGQLPVSSLGFYCIITLDEGLA